MKKSEFEGLKEKDLQNKLLELRKELLKMRTNTAGGASTENPGKFKRNKRIIARILNELNKKGGNLK
ncbi:MAG TPA: 50S ribosomal protein L29 [Candidatus Nanoarchaeia archaeon]|nr:50S ribosomal protein L29 [Candidatus Nanoarchaeia archaeon]